MEINSKVNRIFAGFMAVAISATSLVATPNFSFASKEEENAVEQNETVEQPSKEERIEGLRENLKENAKEDKKVVDEFNLESMQRDKDGIKVMYTPMNDKAINEVVKKVEHVTNESIKEMGDKSKPYINDMPEYVDGLLWLRSDDFYGRLQRSVKFLSETQFLNEDAKKAINAGNQLPLSVTIDREVLKKYNLSGAYEATLAIKYMSPGHYAMLDERSRSEINKLIDLNYKDTFPILDMDKYTKYLSGLQFNEKTGKYTHHFSNGILSNLFGGISALDFYKFTKYIGREPESLLDNESFESFKEVQKSETDKAEANKPVTGVIPFGNHVLSSGNIVSGDPTTNGWMKLNLDVIEGENNYVKGIGSRAGTYQTIYFSPTGNIGSERVVMYCIMGNTEHLKGGKGYAYIYTTPYFLQYDAPKQADMFQQGGPDMDWIRSGSALGNNPVRRLAVMSSYLEILQRGLGWTVDNMYDALNLLLTTGGSKNPFDNPRQSFTKPKDSYHWGSGADESAKAQQWVDDQAKANGGTAVKPGWPGAGSSNFRWLIKKGDAPVDWNSTEKSAIRPLFEGRSWQRTPYIMAYQYGTRGGVSGYGGQSKISGGLWYVTSNETPKESEEAGLQVVKTSANPAITQDNDNYNMAGATYAYKGAENSGYLTIRSNGKSEAVRVKPGTYTIVETSAPQGYVLNTTPKTVSIGKNELKVVTMDGSAAERPIYDRLAIKIDKVVNGKKPNNFNLSGFEFRLTYTKSGFGGESATWKTDSSGKIDFGSEPSSGSWPYKEGGRNVFPLGQYTITETKAIPGVRLDNPLMSSFSIVDAGGTAVKRFNSGLPINSENSTVDNDLPQMGVKVTKLDDNFRTSTEQGDGSLVGVTYQIINRSGRPIISKNTGIENNGVIATIKTVKQGNSFVATSDNDLLPMGSYEIREIDPSTGYLNGNFVQRFNINESNMNKGGIMDLNGPGRENPIMRGSVEITKADFDWKKSSPQGDADLTNVEYKIVNKSKHAVYVDGKTYNNGETITTIKTELSNGKYVAKLASNVLPYGTYEAIEVKPSEGYLNAGWKQTFTIRSNGEVKKFDSAANKWNENKVMRGGVEVVKADFDWKKSSPQGDADLINVEYKIVNNSKHDVYVNGKTYKVGETITTIKTKLEDGKYIAKLANNVLPYGTYRITEVKPSEGYLNANWSQTFSIRADKEVKKFDSVKNKWNENKVMRGSVEVTKADKELMKSTPQGDGTLENAEYTITNKSKQAVFVNGKTYKPGDAVMVIKSVYDKDKKAYIAKTVNTLPYGTYHIEETKQPVGYRLTKWAKDFTIRADKEMKSFTDEKSWNADEVIRGGFVIGKLDRETKQYISLGDSSLLGVEFELKNVSKHPVLVEGKLYKPGEVIKKFVTKEEKDAKGNSIYVVRTRKDLLPYGTYELRETGKGSTGYLFDKDSMSQVKVFSIGYKNEKAIVHTDKDLSIADLTKADKGFLNQVMREDFHFTKKDEETMERMANVPFLVTSKTTGEKHIIVTDENGEFRSTSFQDNESTGRKHSVKTNVNDPDSPITNGAVVVDKNGKYVVKDSKKLDSNHGVWFTGLKPSMTKWNKDGKSYDVNGVKVPVNDNLRAFPYDVYTIEELRADSNAGHKLIKATVVLRKYGKHADIGVDLDYGTIDNKPIYINTLLTLADKEDKVVPALKKVDLTDKLMYQNLDTKLEYTVFSELRLVNKDGQDVGKLAEKTSKFTPKTPSGTYKVQFENTDMTKAKGLKVVAYQTLFDKDGLVVSHADITDEDQTVLVPEIGTKAQGVVDNIIPSSGKVEFFDTVEYKMLLKNKEYDVVAELHEVVMKNGVKTDGGIAKDKDGREIIVKDKFTTKDENGKHKVKFSFEAGGKFEGKEYVVFEKVYKNGYLWGVHADITDEGQTVKSVEIHTTATDNKDNDKYVSLDKDAQIKDIIAHKNLVTGKEYTVVGEAHIRDENGKDLGIATKKDGSKAISSKKFILDEKPIELLFNVDASKLEGKSIVIFEKIYHGDILLATHEDINDKEQTVKVVDIRTTLTSDKTKSHVVEMGKVSLTDTVKYRNLEVGKEYTLKARLMTKDKNGKPVAFKDKDGNEVIGTTKFKAEKENSTVDVKFNFHMPVDSKSLDIVAFEQLYHEGKLIATHEDITDKEQTVRLIKIGTTYVGADKKAKDVTTAESIETFDKVKFDGAIEGHNYTMVGEIHRVVNGKDLGVVAKAQTDFRAEKSEGLVELKFVVNTKDFNDNDKLVAFEELRDKDTQTVLAVHKDINDKEQTLVVKKESKTPKVVKKAKITDVKINTGIKSGLLPIGILSIVVLVALGYVINKRRKIA